MSTSEQGQSGLGLDAQEAAARVHREGRGWVVAATHREVAIGAKQKRRPILDQVLDRSRREGWAIVAADGSIDLTTPHGRAVSAMAAVFGELEAELIGDRTKAALAAAKAKGRQLGRRPAPLSRGVASKITKLRAEGESLRSIADVLNHAGIPAPDGGRCYAATVSRASKRVVESTARNGGA